jgi:hypothetical protein
MTTDNPSKIASAGETVRDWASAPGASELAIAIIGFFTDASCSFRDSSRTPNTLPPGECTSIADHVRRDCLLTF